MSRTQEEPGEVAEASVYRRYAAAANQREAALCCPVEYAADFLSVIPDEVIERDYGCGDPTPCVKPGDTVLDLGSGGGKLCFIAAQVVGAEGRVIGVDYKGKQGPCLERNQAVVYRGPFKKVEDDDGHIYCRGDRMAVCDKTLQLLSRAPFGGLFDAVEPRVSIPLEEAGSFNCKRAKLRDPRETKGRDYDATTDSAGPCYGLDSDCSVWHWGRQWNRPLANNSFNF